MYTGQLPHSKYLNSYQRKRSLVKVLSNSKQEEIYKDESDKPMPRGDRARIIDNSHRSSLFATENATSLMAGSAEEEELKHRQLTWDFFF